MNEELNIINIRQASMYIKHGIKPIDIKYTDRIVFVFKREDTKEVYDLWCKYKLK